MTKVLADLATAVSMVETAWPGTNNTLGYWDPTTGLVSPVDSVAQTPVDYFLYATIAAIIGTRSGDAVASLYDQSNAERKDLYNDMIDRLTTERDRLTAVISAATTFVGALP